MEKELEDIKFKYSFRDYQQETLTMLDKYIHDEKIHIVAPPGAGKTILALELLLRIGNKALILVPTIAIKEQWIERLKKDFINGNKPDLISSKLENPKIITVDTYQSLYALKRKDNDINKIIIDNNIKTLILDEAHHLRKVWKKAIKNIIDKLLNCTTISLTATPPYDNETDYKNYMDLCGIIDAKITIPQLVKSNCLCPHQDFIYFNTPSKEQENELLEHTKNITLFLDKLYKNKTIIKIIALHDYILQPEYNTQNILGEFEFFVAMLSFLKTIEYDFSKNKEFENLNIPKLNFSMLDILLKNLIFNIKTTEQEIFKEEIKLLKQELIQLGCVDEDNNVNLKYNKKISNLLIRNYEKLKSICEIIEIEKQSLKDKLKLVIATDYIKEEYYNIQNEEEIKELGVMPIFKKIISKSIEADIAVLTGSIIIIPTDTKDLLLEIAETEYGIRREEIIIEELGINFDYSKIEFENKHERFRVNIITKLFEKSQISVLIGTIALIGEGWDAPFVNSLIMATYVSSYVTSNQLRGRAIRINKLDENKFSNIWHLVCLEKDNNKYVLGYDYDILSKRFMAFEGIDIERKNIDSGIERLNINNRYYQKNEIKQLNDYMIENSKNRVKNTEIWQIGIKNYIPMSTEKIELKLLENKSEQKLQNHIKNKKIIKNFLKPSTKGIVCGTIATGIIAPLILSTSVLTTLPIASLFSLGLVSKDFVEYKVYNSYKKYLKIVCSAVYDSLVERNIIAKTTKYFIKVSDTVIEYGLKNSSTYEQMIFLKNMKQAINIDSDSRYIIEFYDNACSVPKQFDNNKLNAMKFFKNLKVPNKILIYTKTEKGKNKLLKYKLQMMNIKI